MTTDLKTQIQAYGTQLIDSQPPITVVDVSDLLAKIRELPPIAAPVRQKPRPWVAVGVGVAVLVLFGGLTLLLTRGAADAPPATRPSTVAPSTTPPNTTPPATTTPPDENAGAALSTPTYLDLPNESSIGWKWYETGISSPGRIWRLQNGTYIMYNQGFDGIWDQNDSSVLFSIDGSTERFADPTESFRISTDGKTWNEVPLDRFEGSVVYAQGEIPADAPYFYVSIRSIDADQNDDASWSTWATNNGETWFEVLIDGKSQGAFFRDYVQIRGTTMTRRGGDTGGFLVSSDGGRSFTLTDTTFTSSRDVYAVFAYGGAFRVLVWDEATRDMNTSVFTENPILWESEDGSNWTALGPTSGLERQSDGQGLMANWDRRIEPLADGRLMLVGADATRVTLDDDYAMYILESSDGGFNWQPVTNVPRSPNRRAGQLAWATNVATFDDWVVIRTDEVTLATDGNTWVRIDSPATKPQGPVVTGGALVTDYDNPAWIALPRS